MLELKQHKYAFRPYDPIYPELFSFELMRLRKFLNEQIVIEHIGSTAVCGLGGKRIIDILIAANLKEEMSAISKVLLDIGYQFSFSGGSDDRLFHHAKIEHKVYGVKDFHAHVTYLGSSEYLEKIVFRDYLQKHSDAVEIYSKAKEHAANEAIKFNDIKQSRETYLNIKDPIINEILKRALS